MPARAAIAGLDVSSAFVGDADRRVVVGEAVASFAEKQEGAVQRKVAVRVRVVARSAKSDGAGAVSVAAVDYSACGCAEYYVGGSTGPADVVGQQSRGDCCGVEDGRLG